MLGRQKQHVISPHILVTLLAACRWTIVEALLSICRPGDWTSTSVPYWWDGGRLRDASCETFKWNSCATSSSWNHKGLYKDRLQKCVYWRQVHYLQNHWRRFSAFWYGMWNLLKFVYIIIIYLSWSWATYWPVPVSRTQNSLQRSTMIPSASWGSSVSLPWVIYFEAFYLHVVSSFSCIPVICQNCCYFFNSFTICAFVL